MHDVLAFIAPSFNAYLAGTPLYLALAALGLVIGVVAGLFGVGGGFLLVPLMNAVLGIPIDLAAGSSVCYIIGTSTTGVLRHMRLGNVELRAALLLSIGSIGGAVLGDVLQNLLITAVAHGNQPLFSAIMQGLFVVLLLVIARIMSREPSAAGSDRTLMQRISLGPRIDIPGAGLTGVSILGLAAIGFGGGILTGLMGVSGGVLFMPILIVAVGLSPRMAVGTSLFVVLMASIAAVVKKSLSGGGKISLVIAMALLVASVIGVEIGVTLGQRIGSKRIRKYFVAVIILAIVIVCVKLALELTRV